MDINSIEKYYQKSHALIIGIGEYKTETSLPNAGRDAKAIKNILEKKYGFNILVDLFCENATADSIREVFEDILQDENKIGPKIGL